MHLEEVSLQTHLMHLCSTENIFFHPKEMFPSRLLGIPLLATYLKVPRSSRTCTAGAVAHVLDLVSFDRDPRRSSESLRELE